MNLIKSFLSEQDEFKKAISLSAVLHLFLIGAMIFQAALKPKKPLVDVSQAISVSIANITPYTTISDEPMTAAQVPTSEPEQAVAENEPEPAVVHEPESTKPLVKEKAKPETKEVKKVEKAKEDLSLVKAKQKKALDKIKKMSALEKIRQELSKEAAANAAKGAKGKGKSRTIAAGTALTGLDKIDATQYLQLLDYNIKQVWTLPQWLMNKNLQAQVLVKFSVSGEILSTQVIKSSGNASYDSYCIQAVNKAAPFPKVPAKFSEKFSVDGLVIGFPE